MKKQDTISNVYCIGIGGIGMSALARYYLSQEVRVSGYDKTPSKITEQLQAEGAAIHFTDDTDLLDTQADLVIYTPAVPAGHNELDWYRNQNYPVIKRSTCLGSITRDGFNICIAGTHGKTTISALVAYVLRESGYGCRAFLGGIPVNYATNFWTTNDDVNVMEADEYDRSFLQLDPDIAVISAVDADHLDIYGSVEHMREAFSAFAQKITPGGLLLSRHGIALHAEGEFNHVHYSLQNDAADVYAQDIIMDNGGYTFTVSWADWSLPEVRLNMGGMHNVENAVAAITIAHHLGIDEKAIRASIATFRGVKRRFEYIIGPEGNDNRGIIYIDDYAHHPEELSALLRGAKSLFNDRPCTIIFQPHLFTRTRDFFKEFAEALDMANQVILLPIYPAREKPIDGVSAEMILDELEEAKGMIMKKEELLRWLKMEYAGEERQSMNGQLLITAGAGDIDQLVIPIENILQKQ